MVLRGFCSLCCVKLLVFVPLEMKCWMSYPQLRLCRVVWEGSVPAMPGWEKGGVNVGGIKVFVKQSPAAAGRQIPAGGGRSYKTPMGGVQGI